MGKTYTNNFIVKKINKNGSQYKNKYEKFRFHEFLISSTHEKRYVKVINPETKRIVSIELHSVFNNTRNPFSLTNRIHPEQYVKEVVDKLGSQYKNKYEKFVFHSFPKKKYKGNRRVIIKNIHTNITIEYVISNLKKGRNPFVLNKLKSDPYLKETVNKLGLKFKNKHERFVFLSLCKHNNEHRKKIRILNPFSKKTKEVFLDNLEKASLSPFNFKIDNPKQYLKTIVNKLGLKFKNKYEKFEFHSISHKNSTGYYVNIINLETGKVITSPFRKILLGQNPFNLKRNTPKEFIVENVNKIGSQYKNEYEKFEFHSISNKKRYINIVNPKTNRVLECYFGNLQQGANPFNTRANQPMEYIKEKVNRAGSKIKNKHEKFAFHSLSNRRSNKNKGNRYVNVINLKTKVIKEVVLTALTHGGHNPFNQTQNRVELNILQPKVFNILKSSKVCNIQKEFKLSKRSRVDFLVENKNKINVIEVKNDISHQTRNRILTQKSKYEKDAKKKFGSKFGKVIMVSPKGTNGCYSFKELPLLLK